MHPIENMLAKSVGTSFIANEEAKDIPDDRLPASMQHILDEDGGESSGSCLGDPWGTRPSRFRAREW